MFGGSKGFAPARLGEGPATGDRGNGAGYGGSALEESAPRARRADDVC